jgi:putative endonuclease
MWVGWLKRVSRRSSADRAKLGALGERAAGRHLRRHGYRVLGRNVRTRLGEIDLLAEEKSSGALVIVEVKTTVGDDPPPEVHVDPAKQRKLTGLAHHLARQRRYAERAIRFDVIAIVWPEGARRPARLTHHAGAFEARW